MENKEIYNMNCPICNAKFLDIDDIVVCPVCGAPHHRECYESLGHCKFEEFHGTENQWKPKESTENRSENSNAETNRTYCMYCNSEISTDSLFCSKCGNPVNTNQNGRNQSFNTNFGSVITIDPLGGINPEEDLGGASAIDCASYLKAGTANLIPKFSKINKTGKKISWNWFSFIIPEFYFLYRKCYGVAVLAITAFVVFYSLQIPMMIWMQNLPGYPDMQTNEQISQLILNNIDKLDITNLLLSYAGIFIFFIYRLIFGLFGNYFLKNNCINKIKEIKDKCTIEDYRQTISHKGGVNIFAVMIGYIVIQVLLMIVSIVLQ